MAATKAKTAKQNEQAARLVSVAWTALEKVASKEACRGLLEDGSSTPVRLSVEGQVDGRPIAMAFAGLLNVGHAGTSNTSKACDQAHLVGLLLERLPATTRELILAHLPDEFLAMGGLPPIDKTLLERAKTLLDQLRSRTQVPRVGAVSFERSP